VGRWLGQRRRADLASDYRRVDTDQIRVDDGRVADDGNYASTALSLNGYHHFPDAGAVRRFSPCVGAGVAWPNEIDIDIEGGDFRPSCDDLEDDGFGFQRIGGVSWRQTERFRRDAELRWLYDGEADLDDGNDIRFEDVDYAPATVQVGFSYDF
jgi:opacity protein-like surface antigen